MSEQQRLLTTVPCRSIVFEALLPDVSGDAVVHASNVEHGSVCLTHQKRRGRSPFCINRSYDAITERRRPA